MSNDGSCFECKYWLFTLEKIQNADYLLLDNIFLINNNIYFIIHYIKQYPQLKDTPRRSKPFFERRRHRSFKSYRIK